MSTASSSVANPPVQSVVRPTTLLEAPRLAERLGVRLTIATETFQRTGSFKFRAAYNAAASVPHPKVIAASSGNFGQGLACACQMLGKHAIVVMPANSEQLKVNAVRSYGATVDLTDTRVKSRKERVAELAHEHPDAYIASAYDDPFVIAGNATLGTELAALPQKFDAIIAPMGGGGLTSGIIQGLRAAGNQTPVFAAEPQLGNDGARTFRAGSIQSNDQEPSTLADGARTLAIGEHNWAILRTGLADVIEVTEDQIKEGLRLLFHRAHLKAEPTGALAIGALLAAPERFRGQSVCCVISGANVDPALYFSLINGG